tara:strand:+ start:145 stop:1308 length:1164 start_codon:yes stop_codon:yes gene_type:complete
MKILFRKIYFWEIILVLISIYLTLLVVNFFLTKSILENDNKIIYNNLKKAEKSFSKYKSDKRFFPYLIVNHETKKFEYYINKYNFLPLSTISNKNIYLCNENGIPVNYFSDKFGFRNKNSIYSDDKEKIIFLGDSFIIGFCHEDPETISNIVYKNLKKKNILNLSQGGTGPLTQLATLREYSYDINFSHVFWFLFTGNDFINLEQELKNTYLKKYIDQSYSQNLKIKQNKIDNFYLDMIGDRMYNLVSPDDNFTKNYKQKKINFINLFKLRKIREIIISSKSVQIEKNLIDKYLDLVIKTKVNQLQDKNLTIVILPEERTFKLFHYDKYYRLNYIKKTLAQNNINVLDLSSKYKKKYNFLDLYYSRYTHYNKNAQNIIALDLINSIK